jgi:hypothetical protein
MSSFDYSQIPSNLFMAAQQQQMPSMSSPIVAGQNSTGPFLMGNCGLLLNMGELPIHSMPNPHFLYILFIIN